MRLAHRRTHVQVKQLTAVVAQVPAAWASRQVQLASKLEASVTDIP